MSFDYSIYEKEFKKILYYEELPDGTEKPKAVVQLINNVTKILKQEFKFDENYKYREVNIYPIIITHDYQFETPGLNVIVNSWFQEELEYLQENGLFIGKTKPLTIINIDTLIFHQESLYNNIQLNEVLDKYFHHKIAKSRKPFRSFKEQQVFITTKWLAFSTFIDTYFRENGLYKSPSQIKELLPTLVTDDSLKISVEMPKTKP